MSSPVAGPSIPPSKQATNDQPISGSDSDDDFMPALPPSIPKTTTTATSKKSNGPIGPSLPAGFRRPSSSAESSDIEQEDFAGPIPLPSYISRDDVGGETEGVRALREREIRQAEKDRLEKESKVLKREEWMLVPPKELDLPASESPFSCS